MSKLNLLLKIKNNIALIFFGIIVFALILTPQASAKSVDPTNYWDFRSVDTMKYSRDTAGEHLNNPDFDQEIATQVANIKETGANYVAIATPYDERFVPFLKRWVEKARDNDLKVWFRGNMSAWEGWFGTKRGMSNEDHTKKTVEFIKKHPELFEDGDVFSSCPECENGAFGDPRQTGKTAEYRQFLISEHAATKKAFEEIDKDILGNYWSMNLDVAKLIMDKDTTAKLDGLVVIDHYVSDPKKVASDAAELAKKSGGKIILGEFGAPIPDLHGNQNEKQQAEWIEKALKDISKSEYIYGVNYWVSKGGSASIWDDQNQPKEAVKTLTNYFKPPVVTGTIKDEFDYPVENVTIRSDGRETVSKNGRFKILSEGTIRLQKEGYDEITLSSAPASDEAVFELKMVKTDKNILENIRLWLHTNFKLGILQLFAN